MPVVKILHPIYRDRPKFIQPHELRSYHTLWEDHEKALAPPPPAPTQQLPTPSTTGMAAQPQDNPVVPLGVPIPRRSK